MDVLQSVNGCLANWDKGGNVECNAILTAPHCNPSDPECNDVLTTVYHALITSTMRTWSPSSGLTQDVLVKFIRSVLDSLPSSSSATTNKSSHAVIFGEILVDLVWAIDVELEDILVDAKVAATQVEQSAATPETKVATPVKDRSVTLAQILATQKNAEADKEGLASLVKKLLRENIVAPDVCRERLDVGLVANIGLVADKVAFERKEIRTRTSLFYKQNKYNLLREQSEGYSKLTTEVTSSVGPAHSPINGEPTESITSIEDRARPAWDRVVSLIGYFDLDPNRALDIILDIFSVHLATHYTFFLAFLSCSPWSEHSITQSNGSNTKPMKVDRDVNQFRGKTLDEVLLLAEAQDPPSCGTSIHGNSSRVLAQVLGFKFSYYESPEVSERPPKNLFLMAALLIREGYITLEDLYPHITPTDDDMEALHKAYLADVESRIAAAKISQLAMAAPLESSSSSTKARAAPTETKKTSELKERANQKLGLLNALLALGALRPAIAMLSKFPWVVDAYPEVADLMLRVLKHSLSPLYESTVSIMECMPSFTKPRARYTSTGVVPAVEKKPHLTLWAPTPPSTSTVDFVFFFPNWTRRVPMCSSFDDLADVIEPLMRYIGLHISRDPTFLTKFLRVGRTHMQPLIKTDQDTKKQGISDPSHPTATFWFKVLRLYLLPALPLIRGNAVATVEVWNIMRMYDATLRWRLYGEWKSSTYKSHPELRVRAVQADREAKGILRRLSHNTIDSLSGTVAKLAHSNPCIFFTNAVNQIMAYDNLASVVIQALNFVTIMGFDVLVFIILDALSNPHKHRVKDDGVNTSDWLQSLASFIGMLFRRYSIDLTPILKYIVHQLHGGQTTDIIVLRELIWKMAGIEPLPSLSESQIAAMAGGPTLRVEAVASNTRGARLDPSDAILKGPQRLGKTLLDSSLALPLLIQVAQQRQSCVYRAPNTHLKALASLYDATHGVLLQYLELLTSPNVISSQDYAQRIQPSLTQLSQTYGICAPICMQIIRPTLNGTLLAAALALEEKERVISEEAEKRLKAALTAKREPALNASRVASPMPGESSTHGDATDAKPPTTDTQIPEDVHMDTSDARNSTPSTNTESPWLPELLPLIDEIKKIAPGNVVDVIGPAFYLTFWQLSTYDLAPPAARYEEECSTLRTLSRQEDGKYISADRSSDRAKRATASAHRDKRNRYNNYVALLSAELKEQTVCRRYTLKRLAREKHHWFAHNPKAPILASSIIEHCLQPRCLLSPMDADYCAQIIKVMHLQGTPGFSTVMCYDKLLGEHVKVVIFSCSEYEARNYGRFLLGVLTDLGKWCQDEALFMQENKSKSGGKTNYLPGFQRRWANKSNIAVEDLITWQDFKSIVKKWHRKLCTSFVDGIKTGEFMHVYNAIIVLKEILPVFPLAAVNEGAGGVLSMAISRFLEKEERGDLKIIGRAYNASLMKRESLWTAPKPLLKPSPPALSKPQTAVASAAVNGEKARTNAPPTGPSSSASTADKRRLPAASSGSTPSAPRSHTNGSTQPLSEKANTPTKLAMENIRKPEVIKRIRQEVKTPEGPKAPGESQNRDAMDVDSTGNSAPAASNDVSRPSSQTGPNGANTTTTKSAADAVPSRQKDIGPPTPAQTSRSTAGKDLPAESRPNGNLDHKPSSSQVMPPPANPSQTSSAQELRETAKQSRPLEKPEEKRPPVEPRSQSNNPLAMPSRRRTPSPSSRPGTRNHSVESRNSGGRARSNRGDEGRLDERLDEKRNSRQDVRDGARRDNVTQPRERSGRAERDKESDRDRERGRDRHGDRERRDRDRERDRERDRDKDRDRERDRERDRDRDRDRHRRDDKERDRDGRKDRGSAVTSTTVNAEDRGLPSRPDPSRHRNGQHDDSLGKRRRPTDDDPDRASKRPSRKESHHEDRSRRSSEKDGVDRPRDSERRRKDRDASDKESKSLTLDTKLIERRSSDGPPSAKSLPPSTPSAPRAMASNTVDPSLRTASRPDLPGGRERDWKPPQTSPRGPASTNGQLDTSGQSLRARIGEKERLPSQASSNFRSDAANSGDHGGKNDSSSRDDDRDGSRKRPLSTLSDREKDMDSSSGPGGETLQPPKRPKIDRMRWSARGSGSAPMARRVLPIDPSAGDKARLGKD